MYYKFKLLTCIFILQNIRIMNSLHRRGSLAGHAIPGKELHVLEAEKQQRLR